MPAVFVLCEVANISLQSTVKRAPMVRVRRDGGYLVRGTRWLVCSVWLAGWIY